MRRPLAAVLGVTLLSAAACTGAPEPAAERNEPSEQAAPSTGSTGPADSFTVLATGDVLIHPALTEQAERDAEAGLERDYRPLFEGVRPVVSAADLAICHLEVPLAEDGGDFSGYPSFNAPPELADALADTGYDSCSTASNHTLDQGEDGVRRTLDTLDDAGIQHTGSARTEQEADTPLVLDVNGVKVGQVSFTFGFNGYELPDGKPWMANRLDAEAVIAQAEATRAAGAEVVIASLHWGTEYQHDPTAQQRRLAERLLGADSIDLILGHHAHVVQPIERIDGEWVAYGLGNHVAKHAEPRGVSEEGIAARFRFTRKDGDWRVDGAEYVPTLIELGPPIRLVDLSRAEPSPRHTEALDRTDEVVLSRGGEEDGLTRPGS
ncbi:CapA family protein [Amycolatopsis aidingensis]|uniref:CapA family protein n=1 Tax=Amycolatopsis aidingensis TaxID=2842453 RepID=UPI001E52CBA7|nr:CapA family protein [Amycolatopsis aidingensis]